MEIEGVHASQQYVQSVRKENKNTARFERSSNSKTTFKYSKLCLLPHLQSSNVNAIKLITEKHSKLLDYLIKEKPFPQFLYYVAVLGNLLGRDGRVLCPRGGVHCSETTPVLP